MFRTPGMPIWVTVFALISFLVGCASGLVFLFSGGHEGISDFVTVSLGGRNIGMGLAAGVAVLLKNPSAYIAAFIGGLARDLGDLAAGIVRAEAGTVSAEQMIWPSLFLIVFSIAGILSIMAANKARKL